MVEVEDTSYGKHITRKRVWISKTSTALLIALMLLNIFSGYMNSWMVGIPIPSAGSVLRDLLFFFTVVLFFLKVFVIRRYVVLYPVFIWMLAALYGFLLIPFSQSLFVGAMGYRNIFYPLSGVCIFVFLNREAKSWVYSIKIRYWAVIIFSIIAILGILDFSTGGEFPKLLGFNPEYNNQVGMMVRSHLGITRANAGVSDALNYGYLMAFSALYSTYIISKSHGLSRVFAQLLLVLSFIACILSMTRGSILAVFIVVFMNLFFRSPLRTFIVLIVFLLCSIIALPASDYGQVVIDRFTQKDQGSQSSSDIRILAVWRSLQAISDNPVLGLGLGSQGAATGYQKQDLRIATDNSLLWILLELGVLGFTIIMFAYCLTFYFLYRNSKCILYRKFVLLSVVLLGISALLSSAPVSPTFAICFWIILISEFYSSQTRNWCVQNFEIRSCV